MKEPKNIINSITIDINTSTLDLMNFIIEFHIKYSTDSLVYNDAKFHLISSIPRNVIVKYFANSHSTTVVSRQNIIALEGFIKDEIHMELLKPSSILSREYKYFTLQNVLITSVTVIKT